MNKNSLIEKKNNKSLQEVLKNPKTFCEKVYALLSTVPKGKVTTYGDISHALGLSAYRAVGTAMNKNPYAPDVPCHRVVCSDGRIGGFAHGTEAKIKLLKQEGIKVEKGRIQNFEENRHCF